LRLWQKAVFRSNGVIGAAGFGPVECGQCEQWPTRGWQAHHRGQGSSEYEIGKIPNEQRRSEVLAVLALATERLEISDEAEGIAIWLEREGIGPIDAIHLALASVAKVDFFATCDDRFIRKAQDTSGLSCKVLSALNLVQEVTK